MAMIVGELKPLSLKKVLRFCLAFFLLSSLCFSSFAEDKAEENKDEKDKSTLTEENKESADKQEEAKVYELSAENLVKWYHRRIMGLEKFKKGKDTLLSRSEEKLNDCLEKLDKDVNFSKYESAWREENTPKLIEAKAIKDDKASKRAIDAIEATKPRKISSLTRMYLQTQAKSMSKNLTSMKAVMARAEEMYKDYNEQISDVDLLQKIYHEQLSLSTQFSIETEEFQHEHEEEQFANKKTSDTQQFAKNMKQEFAKRYLKYRDRDFAWDELIGLLNEDKLYCEQAIFTLQTSVKKLPPKPKDREPAFIKSRTKEGDDRYAPIVKKALETDTLGEDMAEYYLKETLSMIEAGRSYEEKRESVGVSLKEGYDSVLGRSYFELAKFCFDRADYFTKYVDFKHRVQDSGDTEALAFLERYYDAIHGTSSRLIKDMKEVLDKREDGVLMLMKGQKKLDAMMAYDKQLREEKKAAKKKKK